MLPVTFPLAAMPPRGAAASASVPEKTATTSKSRSCVMCRTRKVRCDRESPCANCRRANIACVPPSSDRPPRWARRLERIANNPASRAQTSQNPDPAAAQVMERLRKLESLVKELSGQLERANAATGSSVGGSSEGNSPENSANSRNSDAAPDSSNGNVQKQFGRLVLQDANRSRYVSSGFWSRVSDELDGLKMDSSSLGAYDSDTSEDEALPQKPPSTQELGRTPSERHAFLFRHNLTPSGPSPRELHPLPSQIPFLLDIFNENVNFVVRIIHFPTIAKMVRNLRSGDMTSLTPANEALMFSIYYAAITSMEEDDVMTNFGLTRTDLNLKYRLGLEHALAKADFLNVPDLVLIQAFTIFLYLVRRHDSPRFVWMMTGLLVRMGQALGLHRDGTHFEHLTPYEIEMRRRVWWALCMVDLRASEDQGTDCTIALGSFDTKLPSNINDADIEPEISQMPTAREGITDMSIALVFIEIGEISKQMMAQSTKEGVSGMEEQSRLLGEIYQKLEKSYLQYSVNPDSILDWAMVVVTRLVMAKMTLFIYLPILFTSPSEHFSDNIKTKLLVAAIEIAEYNHALNTEQACTYWRWIFQSYTHWYSVVYLLLETSRRPWSPIVERAWVALHSQWLIPAQSHMDKNLRVWVPLRKLMAQARKHREAELERLAGDPQAAKRLEMEDQKLPVPASPGPFTAGSDAVELFRERWHQLLAIAEGSIRDKRKAEHSESAATSPPPHSPYTTQPSTSPVPEWSTGGSGSNMDFEPAYLGADGPQTSQDLHNNPSPYPQSTTTMDPPNNFAAGQTSESSYNAVPAVPTTTAAAAAAAATNSSQGTGFFPWVWGGLWADADPSVDVFANVEVDAMDINMNLDDDVDWYNWVESAKGMEWDAGLSGNGRAGPS